MATGDKRRSEEHLVETERLQARILELEQRERSQLPTGDDSARRENLYRTVFENTGTATIVIEEDTTISLCNGEFERLSGYSRNEIDGKKRWTEFVSPDDVSRMLAQHALRREDPDRALRTYDFRFVGRDGTVRFIELIIDIVKGTSQSVASLRDITGRKRVEDNLRASEERYRTAIENSNDGVSIVQGLAHVYVNQRFLDMFGYDDRNEVYGQPPYFNIHPDDRERVTTYAIRRLKGDDVPRQYQFKGIRKDGTQLACEVSVTTIPYDGGTAILAYLRDITERKTAEEETRRLASVIRHSKELVNIATSDGMMIFLNDAGKTMLGMSDDDVPKTTIMDVIPDHLREKVLNEVLPSITEKGHWEGELQCRNRLTGSLTDVHATTYRIADPDGDTTPLLANISVDITDQKRVEEDLRQTLDRLRTNMETTVQVLVLTAESRDPCTAGHQRRTTQLACAIARELGLPDGQVEAIRMAGQIHDIGKISVPSEILSKASALSPMEYELIKAHATSGAEILKNVESPGPLSEIVRQHHERVNGSGYPRGLTGDEMLIEARILAVADVVEAMVSHRPYRPAFAAETALRHIEECRGILYDGPVVDACLRLFREKDFRFEGP